MPRTSLVLTLTLLLGACAPGTRTPTTPPRRMAQATAGAANVAQGEAPTPTPASQPSTPASQPSTPAAASHPPTPATVPHNAPTNEAATVPPPAPWPNPTPYVRLLRASHVFVEPSEASAIVGKLAEGTVLPWETVAATPNPSKRSCPTWVRLATAGWICAKLTTPAAQLRPNLDFPVVPARQHVPGTYIAVTNLSEVFATQAAVEAGTPKPDKLIKTMGLSHGVVRIGEVDYHRTSKGLVVSTAIRPMGPSKFVGAELATLMPPTTQPVRYAFAFDQARRAIPTFALEAPPTGGAPRRMGSVPARTLLALLSDEPPSTESLPTTVAPPRQASPEFTLVALPNGTRARVASKHLRVIAPAPRPPQAGHKWIDIDLDQQLLVAYEGNVPVYATLISTGRGKTPTPTGRFRIIAKAATMRMAGEEAGDQARVGSAENYDVGDVPWTMRFKKGLFLHSAYWHDGFGEKRSHGCVNLAPRDARFLYAWTTPAIPAGWLEREAHEAQPASTWVQIRDLANPEPAVYDYASDLAGAEADTP